MLRDITIRDEEPRDAAEVRTVNELAFGQPVEADIVDRLRRNCPAALSLVAECHDTVIGHILFTPVVLESVDRTVHGMGLAPMAVHPDHQREGIGSNLVRVGLEILKRRSCPFVVVLGHPEYYPRFGFERASRHGVRCQWEGVPDEAFMILVFDGTAVPAGGGLLSYRPEFEAAG